MRVHKTANTDGCDPKLLDAVFKELERFFSDEYLRCEPFLMRQIQNNPGGWIQIKDILKRNKFNSLRSICTDAKTIAAAIEQVPNGLVQVSSDHQKIRRNPEKAIPKLQVKRSR